MKRSEKQHKPPILPTPDHLQNHYDDELATPNYDFDNPKDLKLLEKQFINYCKITLESLGGGGDRKKLLEYFDYTKHFLRKKRHTYLKYVKTASKKFKSKYPDINIEKAFSSSNATTLENYNMYASLFHIDYASALWILDELIAAGKLGDALQYFPLESDVDFSSNSYFDATHDSDVVESLLFLIKHRNSVEPDEERFFVTQTELELTEKRTYKVPDEMDDLSYRECFDAIIALLPEKSIEKAVNRFKDKSWEIFDAVLGSVNFYRKKEIRLLKTLKRITKDLEDLRLNNLRSLSNNAPFKNSVPSSFNVFANDIEHQEYFRKVDEAAEVETKSNEYKYHQDTLTVFSSSIKFRIETIDAYADTEAGKKLLDLEVDNPYECCFATLYMIDSGDDFAWLYGLCLGTLQTAIFQLPWGRVANVAQLISEEDIRKNQPTTNKDDDNLKNTSEHLASASGNTNSDFTEPEEFNTNQYRKEFEDVTAFNSFNIDPPKVFRKVNFPQIVFEETSIIMPRSSTLISRKSFYKKAGSSESIYKYYLNLLESSRLRETESIAFSDDDYDDDYFDEGIIEQSVEDAIAKEKDVFKKEKDEFRRKLIASHQERNELKKEIRSLKQSNEELNKELKELRLMIRDRNKFDSKGTTDSTIAPIIFPYDVKHRFVVFGGHASWAKAIKPLLKNVRFIDAYAKPNTDLILNADTVWLQSNAIGHSSYYKIMNLVREHGIPLQYFEAASAEKCAEQLAHYDMTLS